MTGKPKRKVSQAELRRQIAAQKARADKLEAQVHAQDVPQQYDHEPPSLVNMPGIHDEVETHEELPPTRSSYTHDQVLDIVDEIIARREARDKSRNTAQASAPRARVGPDIHVKKYQKAVDAGDLRLGSEGSITGHIDKEGNAGLIRPVDDYDLDSPVLKEKDANEAFMRDKIVVSIADTTEINGAPWFNIWVNGEACTFIRGQQKTVARKFVEGLARAKPITYRNVEYTTADGLRDTKQSRHIGLRYHFSVLHDPHPRGAEWLAHVIAQP